ncbi:MAG: AtpZ/AtpI family protein [Ilumatobacteraceae bacterium]
MKLIPPPERRQRLFDDDSTMHGIDVALTVGVFFGIGFLLDRWLGTTPWFMIIFTVLAGVGFFAKYKYNYDAKMDRHQAERDARSGRPAAPTTEDAAP